MGEVRTLPLQRGRHITQMDGICSVTANFPEPPRPEVRGTPLPRTRRIKAYALCSMRAAAGAKRYGARPKGNFAARSRGTWSLTVSAPSHTRCHSASS
jgi:hypothetical protein